MARRKKEPLSERDELILALNMHVFINRCEKIKTETLRAAREMFDKDHWEVVDGERFCDQG